ncbi:MAG: AraC family transcriptional regulator [Clostridiales bacterium]|jgi:AraC family cel operon transcriptional repressor|nr:AraC family transcriptional regulator [Clostridiales bacterium]
MKQGKTDTILHLNDWMSSPEIQLNTHSIYYGDDILHDHDFYEVFYMVDGEIEHTVNGHRETLIKGDIYFLKPSDVHIFDRSGANHSLHRDLVFSRSYFKHICDFINPDFFANYTHKLAPVRYHLSNQMLEHFEGRLHAYYNIPVGNIVDRKAFLKVLGVEILGTLYDKNMKTEVKKYPPWFEDLLCKFNMVEYFEEGLPKILSYCPYDHPYVCRTFKKYMGMNMTDYLNKIRLDYAASMLRLTNENILSISSRIGFSSTSYFNRLFKQEFGLTPKDFRNQKSG